MSRLALRALAVSLCAACAAVALAAGCATPDDGGGATPEDDAGADTGSDVAVSEAAPPPQCTKNDDCPSRLCEIALGTCREASCKDGTKNADETDIDCGGPACEKCDVLKGCGDASDCASGVCADTGKGKQCQPATCADGVKNGEEADVDCGGSCEKCEDGKACKARGDCASDVCKDGKCSTPVCDDEAKNGSETDVDCGGPDCPRCADLRACATADDCKSGVCTGGVCQVPTCEDEVKNGDETDEDCGGPTCSACGVGKGCLTGTDCTSLGCNYANKCAAGRSCTQRYGGDTCGLGGAGGVGAAQWEDCCMKAPVTPTSGPTNGQTILLDKYQVTAGRMRVFLESINYNVRAFVQQARAQGKIPLIPDQSGNNAGRRLLEADWDLYLPVSFGGSAAATELEDRDQGSAVLERGIYSSIRNHLGGRIFKNNAQSSTGCYVGSPGTHAFRFPDGQQDGATPGEDQNVYDTKSMQCIDYLVAQAFCIWDGGRLHLGPEWTAAWGAGTTASPWLPQGETRAPRRIGDNTYFGCRFPTVTDATFPAFCTAQSQFPEDIPGRTIEFANYRYSYEWPNLGATGDYIVFISAPGRLRGRGPNGHADVIGDNYGLTSDVLIAHNGSATTTYDQTPFTASHGWNAGGSWEVHDYSKPANGLSRRSMLLNKYGKLGLRCAYP
ncbi:MAG: hypothetical protein KF782_16860 [Labilithrix sp.]|nr:hypothetical protein [Labilithrix sp.]